MDHAGREVGEIESDDLAYAVRNEPRQVPGGVHVALAEPRGLAGHLPELLAAVPAREKHGWPPALLGAVATTETPLATKPLAASFAVDVNGVGTEAGGGAGAAPLSDSCLQSEVFSAYGTCLGDRIGTASLEAGIGAVSAVDPPGPRAGPAPTARTKGLAATRALAVGVLDT